MQQVQLKIAGTVFNVRLIADGDICKSPVRKLGLASVLRSVYSTSTVRWAIICMYISNTVHNEDRSSSNSVGYLSDMESEDSWPIGFSPVTPSSTSLANFHSLGSSPPSPR